MKKILKWGIIGFGKAASQFINTFKLNSDHEIEIVSSISKTQIPLDKKKVIRNISNSYLDTINSSKVDIIYIGLTNNLHYKYSKLALESGKHLLIEKPACINQSQFNELLGIAKKKNLKIFEAIYFRSHPNISKIKEILKENKLENIKEIDCEFGNDALGGKKFFGMRFKRPKRNNRLFSEETFGGAIWDTGCYSITFANIFLKMFSNKYLDHNHIVNKKSLIGKTNVDMESELYLNYDEIKVKLKTSLINNLKNSISIKFAEGNVEISNLLKIGEFIIIKLNINNNYLEYKLPSNLDIIQIFKDEIFNSLNKNHGYQFNFPLVTNLETLENIKILEKWRNLNV